MRWRNPPKCPFCDKVIAKAVYDEVPKNFFGDTFSHWDYEEHKCEEGIKFGEDVRAELKKKEL